MSDEIIRISKEDLESAEVIERQLQLEQAAKVSQQRVIGTQGPQKSTSSAKEILLVTLFGAIGGLVSWGLNKIIEPLLADNADATASNVSFTAIMALSIGLLVTLSEALSVRSWAKAGKTAVIAVPAALGFGIAIGFIADFLYSNAMEDLYARAYTMAMNGELITESDYFDYISSQTHLPRGIAWALVGISAGLTAGLAAKSGKKLGLAVAGGAVGGFLGGYIFDFIQGETPAQIAGMCITGSLVGLGMGALEQAGKTRWIEIVAGGLAGKQFILYRNEITIGSSPQADITLIKDSHIQPLSAKISMVGSTASISTLSDMPVVVNGEPGLSFSISEGSRIQLGSTVIVYREKSGNAVPTAPINRHI